MMDTFQVCSVIFLKLIKQIATRELVLLTIRLCYRWPLYEFSETLSERENPVVLPERKQINFKPWNREVRPLGIHDILNGFSSNCISAKKK